MLEQKPINSPHDLRAIINKAYRVDELSLIAELCEKAALNAEQITSIKLKATQLVEFVRGERKKSTGIDSFLTEYALSSDEGIALINTIKNGSVIFAYFPDKKFLSHSNYLVA